MKPEKNRLKASMTIEASLAAPFFFLSLLCVVRLLLMLTLILNVQYAAQKSMEQYTALKLAQDCAQTINEMFSKNGINLGLPDHTDIVQALEGERQEDGKEDSQEDSKEESQDITWLDEAQYYGLLVANTGVDYLVKQNILLGLAGIHVAMEELDENVVKTTISYRIIIINIPGLIKTTAIEQSVLGSKWCGRGLSEEEGSKQENDYVYVTKYGSVYHKSLDCSHLDIEVYQVASGAVDTARNASGEKYVMCESCTKNNQGTPVSYYITKYGTSYHSDINCSGLIRHIERVALGDVELPPCATCGGK